MFERYTEKGLRTIFFARYEASQFGSPQIESEHLLLGLLHESQPLPEGSQRPGGWLAGSGGDVYGVHWTGLCLA